MAPKVPTRKVVRLPGPKHGDLTLTRKDLRLLRSLIRSTCKTAQSALQLLKRIE